MKLQGTYGVSRRVTHSKCWLWFAMKSPASNCNECVTNRVVIKVETANHSGREWRYRGDANIGRQVGTDVIMLRKMIWEVPSAVGMSWGISFAVISIALPWSSLRNSGTRETFSPFDHPLVCYTQTDQGHSFQQFAGRGGWIIWRLFKFLQLLRVKVNW